MEKGDSTSWTMFSRWINMYMRVIFCTWKDFLIMQRRRCSKSPSILTFNFEKLSKLLFCYRWPNSSNIKRPAIVRKTKSKEGGGVEGLGFRSNKKKTIILLRIEWQSFSAIVVDKLFPPTKWRVTFDRQFILSLNQTCSLQLKSRKHNLFWNSSS